MTDLLSVMFMVGIVVVFSIAGFVLKNSIMIIVSGLGWSLSSIYMFNLVASGDSDYGTMTSGFGYLCLIMAMACFFSSWWIHRKQTILTQNDKTGETFYTEGDPEFKEINDMYKARANKKKLRGR
jgi:flagellar biosynthesis protein FlhB